jgi:hypothetical protein
MTNLIRFVVIDGDIFGAILPTNPLSIQVLSTRIGAATDWRNGTYPLPLDPAWVRSADCPIDHWDVEALDLALVCEGKQPVKLDPKHVRPATKADFENFRVLLAGYANDPAYEVVAG